MHRIRTNQPTNQLKLLPHDILTLNHPIHRRLILKHPNHRTRGDKTPGRGGGASPNERAHILQDKPFHKRTHIHDTRASVAEEEVCCPKLSHTKGNTLDKRTHSIKERILQENKMMIVLFTVLFRNKLRRIYATNVQHWHSPQPRLWV